MAWLEGLCLSLAASLTPYAHAHHMPRAMQLALLHASRARWSEGFEHGRAWVLTDTRCMTRVRDSRAVLATPVVGLTSPACVHMGSLYGSALGHCDHTLSFTSVVYQILAGGLWHSFLAGVWLRFYLRIACSVCHSVLGGESSVALSGCNHPVYETEDQGLAFLAVGHTEMAPI